MDLTALRTENPQHWARACAIRALTLDTMQVANSGPSAMSMSMSMSMGMADVASVLFSNHLKFDASQPDWPDRDRFIMSPGHGSMLLYALLHLTGYADMTMQKLRNFHPWGAGTAGHPEYGHASGIQTTPGPLGQGLGMAVGMAMAEEIQRARFGRKLMDHRTYVIVGHGCLMEGISHEAIGLAGRYELGRLVVLWDNISNDSQVDLSDRTKQVTRFKASGWKVIEINGHDPGAIDDALAQSKKGKKPTMIACKTHIALGYSAQGRSKGQGTLTDPLLIRDTKADWLAIGAHGSAERKEWEAHLASRAEHRRAEFTRAYALDTPKRLTPVIRQLKKRASAAAQTLATRASSEMVLDAVNPVMRETVGGSAELTGSNNTRSGDMESFGPENRKGRYVHWGGREHGMAAAMNGMVLHGGVRAYGDTCMAFTDYARPAMRLAAQMRIPTVFVMTHDGIGPGENGPTHQPVEHLAISRATPNTWVFRPADTVETAEAWELALNSKQTPSVLSLTRQELPLVRTEHKMRNLSARGAYVLAEASPKRTAQRQVILIATGSEVSIALAARNLLEAEAIGTRVVSMPCMELFAEQDETYRRRVLPRGPVRVGIEAAVRQGWDRWLLGERGRARKADFVGMDSFGNSAPAADPYHQFAITPEATVAKVKALLAEGQPTPT